MNRFEKMFNDLTCEYSITAREYFMILRLAIYHIDKVYLEKSSEVARYDTSSKIYHCACNILTTLHKEVA